jgi:hypothetical protein
VNAAFDEKVGWFHGPERNNGPAEFVHVRMAKDLPEATDARHGPRHTMTDG